MSAPGNSSVRGFVRKEIGKPEDFTFSKKDPDPVLPSLSSSRTYRRGEARKRQTAISEERELSLSRAKSSRVPVSIEVKAKPGDSTHLFTAPVNGEVSDIRIKAELGNTKKKVPIRLSLTNNAGIKSEDVVVEQGASFEMLKPLQMRTGDTFSVQVKSAMSIIATMMFKEE